LSTTSEQTTPAQTPKRQSKSSQLVDFRPHFDTGSSFGPEWADIDRSYSELSTLFRKCGQLSANHGKFQNESEETFAGLRRAVLAAQRPSRSNLGDSSSSRFSFDEVPEQGMGFVWDFLILVAARRPFFRGQTAEVAGFLKARDPWARVLASHPELLQLADEFLSV